MTKYYMVQDTTGNTKILSRKKWKQFLFEENLNEGCLCKTKNNPETFKFHKGYRLVSISYDEDEVVEIPTPVMPDTFIGKLIKLFGNKKKQKAR